MSAKVKLRGDAMPRFPARCICCLDAPIESRTVPWDFQGVRVVSAGAGMQGKVSWNKTVAVSGIPYCHDHAALHDAYVTWGKTLNEYQHQLRLLPPIPRWVAALYVFTPAAVLAVPGAIIGGAGDADPMLGVLGALIVGLVLGALFLAVRRRLERGRKRSELGSQPVPPPSHKGEQPRINFHGRALGLDVKASVDASSGYGVPSGMASVWIDKLVFHFDNPEYARLFGAENRIT